MAEHRRYYRIGDITLQVESDLPITDKTFNDQLDLFQVDGPSPLDDTVTIHHHFQLPNLEGKNLGKEIYRKEPWAIYQQNDSSIYLGILPQAGIDNLHCYATFNLNHTKAHIYFESADTWRKGNLHSLSLLPTDQILIARLLADRNGCFLHSAGAILNGSGLLFVGHSEAGKSTITQMLMDADLGVKGRSRRQIEILSDDRNIVRRWGNPPSAPQGKNSTRVAKRVGQGRDGWRVYGTWNHSAVPIISPLSAPLQAVCFIEQATENTITVMTDRSEIIRRLLACVIKPLVTTDWWNKTLDLIEQMAREVPCYVIRFDKSGAIVEELINLTLSHV